MILIVFCFIEVFEDALNHLRSSAPDLKEERAMLLEKWLNLEASSGELGDVSLVQSKLPKKLKKRRQVSTEDGSSRYVTNSLSGFQGLVYMALFSIWSLLFSYLILLNLILQNRRIHRLFIP